MFRLFISPNGFHYDLTLTEAFLLFLSGFIRSMGMIFFIKAFQLDKAGRAAGLNFLQIITGYTADMIFFGYSMQAYEMIGATIIVGCSVMVFVLKAKGYSD
jgi:drug/metabolite transporter (DMT)-like permease